MKKQIFGRRYGTEDEFVLLVESEGVIHTGGIDAQALEFELNNVSRNVNIFQEKNVEGYVLIEGDSTRHEFTPNKHFTLTVLRH